MDLFGLHKWHNVDRTLASLAESLERIGVGSGWVRRLRTRRLHGSCDIRQVLRSLVFYGHCWMIQVDCPISPGEGSLSLLKILAVIAWVVLTFLMIASVTVMGVSSFYPWALVTAAGVTWIVLKMASSMLDAVASRQTGEENSSSPEMVVCEGCKEPTPSADPKCYWCGYEKRT